MDSFCPLFVFKVLLERVVLLHEGSMLLGVPLSARFQFLDLHPLEALEALEAGRERPAATADPVHKQSVTFEGFAEQHTPPFYSDSTTMIRSLQRQPLVVTLYQQHPAAPLPVVVGSARVPVSEQFGDLLTRARKCAARHPLAAVVRGEYPVRDVDDVQVGALSLTARLVCFDGAALEQMRADKSRADATSTSAVTSGGSRRSSGPCSDDKLVTTATGVCLKCQLPKRPPSSGGRHSHAHLQEPSQATILEEINSQLNGKDRPSPTPSPRQDSAPAPSRAGPRGQTSSSTPPALPPAGPATTAPRGPTSSSTPPARTPVLGQVPEPLRQPPPRLSDGLGELGVYGRQPSRISTVPPPSGVADGDQGMAGGQDGSGPPWRSSLRINDGDAAGDIAADEEKVAIPTDDHALQNLASTPQRMSTTRRSSGAQRPPSTAAPCVAVPSPFSSTTPRGSQAPSTMSAPLAAPRAASRTQASYQATKKPAADLAPCVAIPSPISGSTLRGSLPSARTVASGTASAEGAVSGADQTSKAATTPTARTATSGTAPAEGAMSGADQTSKAATTPTARTATSGAAPADGAVSGADQTSKAATTRTAKAAAKASKVAEAAAGKAASPGTSARKAAASRTAKGAAAAGGSAEAVDVAGRGATQPGPVPSAMNRQELAWGGITHHQVRAGPAGGPADGTRHGEQQRQLQGRFGPAASARQFRPSDADWRARDKESIAAHFKQQMRAVAEEMNLNVPLPKYGHKDCVTPHTPVPGDEGWLWNARTANYQPRPGWYPGAIPRGLGLHPTPTD